MLFYCLSTTKTHVLFHRKWNCDKLGKTKQKQSFCGLIKVFFEKNKIKIDSFWKQKRSDRERERTKNTVKEVQFRYKNERKKEKQLFVFWILVETKNVFCLGVRLKIGFWKSFELAVVCIPMKNSNQSKESKKKKRRKNIDFENKKKAKRLFNDKRLSAEAKASNGFFFVIS